MTDDASWTEIADVHGKVILRVAYQVLGSLHDAEDVTQQVLLEMFEGKCPVEPGIAKRLAAFRAIDKLRAKRNEKPINASSQICVSGEGLQSLERQEEGERLRQAISQLPMRQAQCFWLRYVEGYTNREIADHQSMTESAVSTALHRARHKLRKSLKAERSSIDG